jgi:small subunit ribosomal protein S1
MTIKKEDHNDNKFRPAGSLDDALQHEIDEALGDMSLDELISKEESAQAAESKPSAPGLKKGKVIAIHGDDIFVDMGGKSQGILPAVQFEEEPLPNVGDTVEVVIEGYNPAEGFLILSRKGAIQEAAWDSIEVGQIVEGRVTDHNKGGLEIDLNGLRAFMPISQIEMFRVEDLHPYVNQRFKCEVTDVNRQDRNIVLSRRNVLEREAAEAREKAFGALAPGQILTGTVKTIMPYGAFVDIGGVDGLLHVSDMSYSRVNDPHEIVQEGMKVEVKVLKIDPDTRKISLGLKQAKPDPWTNVADRWPIQNVVRGRVTKLMDFGAFVELEPGIEGLIPMSEFTYQKRIHHPSEIVKEGDNVDVRVLSIDMERKRISLSLKQVGDDPWMGASARWPVGNVVTGKVTRMTDFGAFVELSMGVEGLVHISEISETRIHSVAEALKIGQEVQAKVLDVDETARRIGLSIKQVRTMPEYTGDLKAEAEQPAPDAKPQQKKRKKPLKGGF